MGFFILNSTFYKKMATNNKTIVGALSYITIIGFIIALLINANKKGAERSFNAFHLRQALGLGLLQLIVLFAFQIIDFIIGVNFGGNWIRLAVFIFSIIGILNAVKGEMKELPLIGKFISDKLGRIFE